jgi:hypothetical protein
MVEYRFAEAVKLFHQLVSVLALFLFLGAAGTECLALNAPMNDSEKACCQQMAGQCDTSMAAKHPCCKRIQRHDEVDVKNAQHLAPIMLPLYFSLPDSYSLDQVATRSLAHSEILGRPPTDTPTSSIAILRI